MKNKNGKLFWIIFIVLVIFALYFGYIYYYKNYYITSNNSSASEFNLADLKYEELFFKCSKEQAFSVLGEPNRIANYNDDEGYYIEIAYYDRITLTFSNDNLIKLLSTDENFKFKDIKVGDSEEKVLNSFRNDENSNYVYSSDEKIIGQYIYGNFNVYNLNKIQTKDAIFYAYKTFYSTSDTYNLVYAYMCPPYKNNYASIEDDVATLEFEIKDETITSISWSVCPIE